MRAVDGVSFRLQPGEVFGLVGESGCGKTVTALSIMGLVPSPPGRQAGGQVLFRGKNLLAKSRRAMDRLRRRHLAMIFQGSATALNPVYTVGRQLADALRLRHPLSRRAARQQAQAMLQLVGLHEPRRWVGAYPHQLSGGMAQRVLLALALARQPELLIADEPITALDVISQKQIIALFQRLQAQLSLTMLLISHDLSVVGRLAQRTAVMYAGQVVEKGPAADLLAQPFHPYTAGLLAAMPRRWAAHQPLPALPGQVPDPLRWPQGCRFHPRCPFADDECRAASPPLAAAGGGRRIACWHWQRLDLDPGVFV